MSLERMFWRWYAVWYDDIWDGPLVASLRETIVEVLAGSVGNHPHVIDLGCGTGLTSPRDGVPSDDPASTPHSRVVGVDTAPTMLERAVAQGRIDEAIVIDAAATGLPGGRADAVISTNLIQFHPEPASVVSEALRLVRPGGVVVLTWPVDSLTRGRVFRADRRAGRPLLDSLRALVLGRAISALAALALPSSRALGHRARAGAISCDLFTDLRDSSGHEVLVRDASDVGGLASIQRVVVLTRPLDVRQVA